MFLYKGRTTLVVVGGFALMHLLVFSLCVFWTYQFIIKTYTPDGFLLIFVYLAMLVAIDAYAAKKAIFDRFLTRCFVDEEGILCRRIGRKPWKLEWNKICVYGTSRYAFATAACQIVFFSIDPNEEATTEILWSINRNRIIFEVRDGLLDKLGVYMPDKMKKQLRCAVREQGNAYYRIKV